MAVEQEKLNSPAGILQVAEVAESEQRGITIRAVILGFLLTIPAVFWGVYGDVVSQTDLTSTSLMMPPILILTAILPLNWTVRKIRNSWALAQSELITIYIMLTVAVVLSGMGMIQFLCTTLGAVYYYKTPENEWAQYLDYVPHTIMPKFSAIDGFYKGGQPVPWSAWKWPLALWSGFIFAMLFCMLCINSIIRKQWMDRERLTFPITQLPLDMTNPKTSFFKNKLMWVGFLLAASVESLNSLNFLYPQFPYLQIRADDLSRNFQNAPWNAIGYFPTTFYPLAIGLGFVLAADVSFSCWFFFLVTKFENVFVSAVGWTGGEGARLSSPPYLGQQGTGAFIGIAISVVFIARKHLYDVFRKVITNTSEVDDTEEALSYRTAVFGLLTGFIAMIGFAWYVGIHPLLAAVFLLLYLSFALTITRIRAVAGPPWVMGPDIGAAEMMIRPFGSGILGKSTLIALAYFNWFSIEMRCCAMPHSLEGMKMAQAARMRQRTLSIVMLGAIVAGIAVGFWACLSVWYTHGADMAKVEPWRTGMGRYPFDRVTNLLANPTGADIPGTIAMFFGGVFTLILSWLRTQFVWFPFNPIGYVLANTGTMYWLWCPFMIAWACKVLIIKYGGIKGYRTMLPFFLGLVLGDFITSSCWALAGSVLGINMYRCFPC